MISTGAHDAKVVLQQLANDHHGKGALPNDAQELANEAMVGIIFCNGYRWQLLRVVPPYPFNTLRSRSTRGTTS